jgi:hypothetical protein
LWTKSQITEVQKPSTKAVEKPSVKEVQKSSSTVEFRDCTVAVSDLADISSALTAISFVDCHSKEWVEIGQRLVALP